MIPAWLRCLLSICQRQSDHQDKPSVPKKSSNNPKSRSYRNTQPTSDRAGSIYYINDVNVGTGTQDCISSSHGGHHGESCDGEGCGGGD